MSGDLKSKLLLYKENQAKKPIRGIKSGRDIHGLLDGFECSNDDGCCFALENRYPLSYIHGGCSLGAALNLKLPTLRRLFGDFAGEASAKFDITKALFLDTETTGLSGGAGTVAFLIGAGFFEEDAFVIRQYFMRDYDEEPALLRELNTLLSRSRYLVTFNGKAFDWSLLLTRYISNRMRPALSEPVHADLLFPSRRIWKLKLESCRLSSLEENILGEYRVDDVPGALIPAIYFKYLEDRDATGLVRVVRHNELDVISMVSLLVKVHSIVDDPLAGTNGEYELLGAGRIYEVCGELDMTVSCFEKCTEAESIQVKSSALRRLTGIYKRSGNYEKAVEHWENMLSGSGPQDIFPLVELAKYYEHKEKNIDKALELVENAIKLSSQLGYMNSLHYGDLKKRYERLKRKAGRNSYE